MAEIEAQIIPIIDAPQFEYVATIEGVSVKLVFYYNYRTEHFHMTMTLLNGDVVFDGYKIVPESPFPLTSPIFTKGFNGTFILTPIKGKVEDNRETMISWASYYFLSYVLTAAS